MKQVIVGTYEIGYDQVEIVLRDGDGGEFYLIPEKGRVPRINIGADHTDWRDVVAVLLHEAFEFALERLRCRYIRTDLVVNDHNGYLFIVDHITFSESCQRVAELISVALPDLAREWERWHKPQEDEIKPELTVE